MSLRTNVQMMAIGLYKIIEAQTVFSKSTLNNMLRGLLNRLMLPSSNCCGESPGEPHHI